MTTRAPWLTASSTNAMSSSRACVLDIGPTVVASSRGSPTTAAENAADKPSTKAS